MTVRILTGDCTLIMPTLPAASFDSCVTDPPYGLKFMGRAWDAADNVAFRPETWAEVLRVLKPGAHLLAFGGTRTFHRMAVAIEDAGFELRDTVMWLYGSGFPKSLDVSKAIDKAAGAERDVVGSTRGKGGENLNRLARLDGNDSPDANGVGAYGQGARQVDIDIPITAPATEAARQWQGWGTALKPAWEPVIVARKPLIGTVAANVLAHGTGALNIDGCRVVGENPSIERREQASRSGKAGRHTSGDADTDGRFAANRDPAAALSAYLERGRSEHLGRFPANVLTDGSDEVLAAFAAFGERPSDGPINSGLVRNGARGVFESGHSGGQPKAQHGDTGTAARFFKACEWTPDENASRLYYSSKADASDRLQSRHPTIKPVNLLRYLCRLITPPGGHVLDCFAGSGTTGMAAMAEGFNATLIERDPEYVADIRKRIAHVSGADTPLFAEALL